MAESLIGPKVLLMGEGGTGKTHSLGTLVDWCAANNLEVFALFTENGRETLLGYWKDRGLPIPDCDARALSPTSSNLANDSEAAFPRDQPRISNGIITFSSAVNSGRR